MLMEFLMKTKKVSFSKTCSGFVVVIDKNTVTTRCLIAYSSKILSVRNSL